VPEALADPSPKERLHEVIELVGALLPEPWKVTWPASTVVLVLSPSCATGGVGGGASTTTEVVAIPVLPSVSVTVSVAVKTPAAVYVCETVGEAGGPLPEACALPSPKSNVQDAIVPVRDVLSDPSKLTVSGATPDVGITLSAPIASVDADPLVSVALTGFCDDLVT
jgi:hypothetical protein